MEDVRKGLQEAVNERCECAFTVQHITLGEFQCLANADEVTYCAKINGTTIAASSMILAFAEEWVTSSLATLVIQGVRLNIDSTCKPVAINSFTDPECDSTIATELTEEESNSTTLIVGGVAAVVLLSLIAVVAVTTGHVLRRRHAKRSSEHQAE